MDTKKIKVFAQEARHLLSEGVRQRLRYWGFTDNGENEESVEVTQGGYIFRGEIFTDTSVPAKWRSLKDKLISKQAVDDLVEEAAYTWFNRLMAIKILEENKYIQPALHYSEGIKTPMIVQNAKKGNNALIKKEEKDLLLEYLKEEKEELAFGLLLINLCNTNVLLHDVFGRIDDYTELLLPQNILKKDGLLALVNLDDIDANDYIEPADYKEVELIGWLYQFYISERKAEVFKGFKKNKKARAEDIPAATQIFTPKWIVKYMVQNTVGKIYLDYEPDSDIKADLRYLVENDSDSSSKAIIDDIKELTLLDPACGSGHILVTGFELLMSMYLEEGYNKRKAVESILEYNLYGLDIDDRAMQLARFAVLIKAASYDVDILTKGIMPHVHSFVEEKHFSIDELQRFLGQNGLEYVADFKEALELLNQGKNIGSALKFDISDEAVAYIQKQYNTWLDREKIAGLGFDEMDIWIRLRPMLDLLLVLTKQYAAVVANPPYMGQKSMNADLKTYVNAEYPLSKSDLFAVFMEAMMNMVRPDFRMGCITMESWMFLSSYEKLRTKILKDYSIVSLAHFGWHIIGIAFGTASLILEKSKNIKIGEYSHLSIDGVDREINIPFEFPIKDNGRFARIPQTNFSKIPGSPIAYWVSEKALSVFDEKQIIKESGDTRQGMATSDNKRFLRLWFEVAINNIGFGIKNRCESKISNDRWFPYNKGGSCRKWYGNQEYIVDWENDGERIISYAASLYGSPTRTVKSMSEYFKPSLSWSKVTAGKFSLRFYPKGFIFDVAGCCIFYDKDKIDEYHLGLLNSKIGEFYLKILSPTLNYEAGSIANFPITKCNNKTNIDFVNNLIISSKKDWDARETSWDFEKAPLLNESKSLKEAYNKWEEKVSKDFFQLHENEEELNRIFIEIYALQEELTPDVLLKDITILQEELDKNVLVDIEPTFREKGKEAIALPIKRDEVISQFLSYCLGLFLGRYRLDKEGLNIAHPNATDEELASYDYNSQKVEIDEDAIIPIMGDDCEFPDDALVRINEMLLTIWGEDSLTENLNFIQECLGMDLHKWLNEKLWKYHTSMYKKKPIYWLFASNPKKPNKAAFKVLVYMHRMDKFTVQKIQRNYLYPHQEYIKKEIADLLEREDSLNNQEQKELEKLQKWEIECRDYNEVLKELANQQIEFDLDDGVDLNYTKFEGAVAKIL